MIVLDTNVLSELMKPQPATAVMAWADQLSAGAVAITAMNEAEILHGIARLPDSQRKQQLQQSWSTLVADVLMHPVLPFNSAAAHWYAALVSHRERMARPISSADAVIAATALAHDGQLATRNTTDFEAIGLPLINPWARAGAS
ncbi:PIN domain protein [Synechococcus sp. A15-127]|uniref:type II toxin-antitoxin system VapC family toxin n=1 Tax=Synechococcus sp. A15-127 TaxID=1050624 RepID=UPI001646FFA5|nr:type II toxin-antitoxin system VapC family toxin [Synechococcus sp. A15-127]QNI94304.1 PIN domain protein [Synechococcus sp. A15-127]